MAGSLLRLRLDIAYDGTDFSGWAAQPDRRTVAGELDTALVTVLRSPVPMVVAGRTDAGVHASGQVAHIDVDPVALDRLAPRRSADGNADPSGCDGLRRRLAGLLPPDVRVRAVRVAPDGFDARFGALRRHYEYRIALTDWGVDPLHRVGVLALGRPLDTGRMARAATALLGLHDFAAFCRPRTDVTGRPASTVRELQRLDVLSGDDLVTLRVSADAFCHSMVRALVGMLVRVGLGQEDVAAPAQLLAGRARTSRVSTAPARGLTLVGVDYPADQDLAERVRTTRALRDPLPPNGAPEFPPPGQPGPSARSD